MSDTGQVYDAEHALQKMLKVTRVEVHGRVVDVPGERKFGDLSAVQTYVDKVLALNWVQAAYQNAVKPLRVVKKPKKTANRADCGHGVMRLPVNDTTRWTLRETVILHEISHHLTPGESHGEAFRTCFAHLVDEVMSPETGWLLRTMFWDRGLTVGSAAHA